jgi:methionyl-tRNA formyltransferase
MNNIKFAFWGSSEFSIYCLEELKNLNVLPTLIITTPDKPVGRGLILTPNVVKIWAEGNNIKCLTPDKLRDQNFIAELSNFNLDASLVASYGKIIPREIIDLPKSKTLNIHPSLLPKYRGPSPLQEQILNNDSNIGVTIMQIDEEVDHGPIVAQEKIDLDSLLNFKELEEKLAKEGSKLFVKILPDWIAGKIEAKPQEHDQATFTKKVEKSAGLLDIITGDQYKNYLKYLAYFSWPFTFFFVEKDNKKIRIIIKEAEFKDGALIIKRVIPEGKKEMPYSDFLRGLK